MLIRVDASAVDGALASEASSGRSLVCLENLLAAHYGSKHVISLDVAALRKLKPASARLSERARAALRNIEGAWSELEGLRRTVRWQLELGLGDTFDGVAMRCGERHVIRANLHHFEDFERTGCAVLLGENLTDARLYVTLSRALMAARGWRARVSCSLHNGGGDTIGETFAQIADTGAILLAIADSDRAHPTAELGPTAKKIDADGRPAFQRVIVLHVRAAENLLPFTIYEHALGPHQSTPSIPEKLGALEKLVPGVRHPWRAHVNLKKGLRVVDVEAMTPGSDEERFWSLVSVAARREQCFQGTRCQREVDCVCWVVDGLGTKALERAVAWIERESPRRLAKLLDLENDSALASLCEEVASWTIGPALRMG